ncbi:acyltransferase [Bacillus sp. FJAT-22090]|uniref:acyltransferase n=1 Tax=Bacillus sp. FJAT-22090 TaxID=1581038 RepID=UPI0011A0BD6C|nr:acyltransferase [Bacillus sp. FJAT-22090]
MQLNFDMKLDNILGTRKAFHIMECEICGFDEIYYKDPKTNQQIGVACEGCNYIKKFDFTN